jgi:non-ribosomal peptide synthetase component E (peptide arylation enzyme)
MRALAIHRWAHRQPDRPAVISGETTLSYAVFG